MKAFLVNFLLVAGIVRLVGADESQFSVAPGILNVGQTASFDSVQNKDGSLSLAAGGQIARTFHRGAVILHEVSRPSFMQNESDWPIAVVGPFAAVFKEESGKGQLVLASVDGVTRVIPGSYAFDTTGRSINPIDLTLAYDSASGIVVVAVDEALQSFQITPPGPTVEVLISAGANTDWLLDTFNVEILPEQTAAASLAGPNGSPTSGQSGLATAGKSTDAVKTFLASQVQKATVANSSLAPALSSPKANAATKLEIFTPPAIRSMTANLIRASVKAVPHN